MKKQHTQKRFLPKLKIKKGDTVAVISGDSRGTTGIVMEVLPRENKAIVEGVNIVKRHTKPNAQNQQGGIIEKSLPVNLSNLMLVVNGTSTKIGRKLQDGKLVRYSKKSGEVIK